MNMECGLIFFLCCKPLIVILKLVSIFEHVRIMTAALSFLLDFEKIEDVDDSDDSSSEDDATTQQPQIILNKEALYKVGCSLYLFLHDSAHNLRN